MLEERESLQDELSSCSSDSLSNSMSQSQPSQARPPLEPPLQPTRTWMPNPDARKIRPEDGGGTWQYEMRREMQEIQPRLWLGPYFVARQRELLQRHGITHILCVRDPREASILRAFFPQEFCYLELEVLDDQERNLISLFPRASQFLRNALAEGGGVLVHCNTGIYRSPAFVAAFLMEEQQLSLQDALQLVQNRRFCINPNAGYRNALREYEPILWATKSHQQQQQQQQQRQSQQHPPILRADRRRRREEEDTGEEEADRR